MVSLEHGACPPGLGIVGPIASVSASKPLTAKPDAVNGFGLAGKVAVNGVEAELPPDPSKFSRVTKCSMKTEGTTVAQLISAGARKRSLYYTMEFSSFPAPLSVQQVNDDLGLGEAN